jgi:hypothetical protein
VVVDHHVDGRSLRLQTATTTRLAFGWSWRMAQVVPPQYYLRTSSFINDKDLFCVPYISLFTCEAEYIAATDAAREATWLRCLLAEIDPPGAPATSLTPIK